MRREVVDDVVRRNSLLRHLPADAQTLVTATTMQWRENEVEGLVSELKDAGCIGRRDASSQSRPCGEWWRGFYFPMRRLGDGMPLSLAGSLLVAHRICSTQFSPAVLFIYEHDSNEGAGGLIINRPLDKQVVDLVNEAPPEGLADVPVFLAVRSGRIS